jgi:hypothetical protein
MKYLLALAAVVWLTLPFTADAASYVAKDGENWVRIYDEPCEVVTGWLKMKKAVMHYKGQDYQACWMTFNQAVLILDSEMDLTPVPIQSFKKDVGV